MAGKSACWGIVILICAVQVGVALNTASQAKNAIQVSNQSIKVKTDLVEVPDPARNRYVVSNLVPVDAVSAANSSDKAGMQVSVGKSRVVQGVRMYPSDRHCPYYF